MMIITRMEDKVLRFKKFFDLNFPKVKTFAWQLLKSEEDAEDIAQDIFVKLWEKPDLWLEREKLDSYLYTVVRNHIYNFLKHKAVEYDYLDVAAEKMQMAERGCLRRMMNFALMNLNFLFRWLLNVCRNSAGVFF